MAQPAPPVITARALPPQAEPDALPLWPDAPAAGIEHWTQVWNERVVRNVVRPTLTPVLPPAGRGNGRAVLVVPGGGYNFVAVDNEGFPVAQRLAAAGYAAYVLKYRVKPTPPDADAFAAYLGNEIRSAIAVPHDQRVPMAVYAPALEDAQQAVRLVRRLAAERGVSGDRIAYLGFSAGARTGRALVEAAAPGTQVDSVALIYGPMGPLATPATPPPLFVALAADDPLIAPEGFALVQSWLRAGQRAELHFYERGGHGFALRRTGTTSEGWFDDYLAWLARQ